MPDVLVCSVLEARPSRRILSNRHEGRLVGMLSASRHKTPHASEHFSLASSWADAFHVLIGMSQYLGCNNCALAAFEKFTGGMKRAISRGAAGSVRAVMSTSPPFVFCIFLQRQFLRLIIKVAPNHTYPCESAYQLTLDEMSGTVATCHLSTSRCRLVFARKLQRRVG